MYSGTLFCVLGAWYCTKHSKSLPPFYILVEVRHKSKVENGMLDDPGCKAVNGEKARCIIPSSLSLGQGGRGKARKVLQSPIS